MPGKWFSKIFAPLAGMSDEQLMWRVQMDEDHEAFGELVRRWEKPVRALCIQMTVDEAGGEDLAQEAFLRVFAHRRKFEQGRKFSTWLWRIALNLCHDENRRAHHRAELPLEEEEEGLSTAEPSPDKRLMEAERAGLVRAALLELPETHRAVVVLREYQGLKLREIAEVLEIPEGTAKSRLADALSQLARRLRTVWREENPGLRERWRVERTIV